MTEEIIDQYDEPWKEALDEYLKEFLELLFPEVHAGIDWSVEPQSRDKEFQQLIAASARGKQIADKLWEVHRLDGTPTLILIHVEVQGRREADFPERIFRYGARIREAYDCDAVSLAVLADPSPSWRPDRFEFEAWGYRLSLVYPTAKLLDLPLEDLEGNRNPFAPIVLAHRMTQATKGEPRTRFEWKWRIVRSLYEREYGERKVRRLFRLVDWFMRLPEPLAIEFRENLERFEGDQKMPYVTSVEQLAKAEGKAEGKAETILLFLEARFGAISEKLSSTICGITDSDRLTELARLSAVATTIEEFEAAILSL